MSVRICQGCQNVVSPKVWRRQCRKCTRQLCPKCQPYCTKHKRKP